MRGRRNALEDDSHDERVTTRQPGQTMGLHRRFANRTLTRPLSRWERGSDDCLLPPGEGAP
ncbi:hypothetical protein XAC2852_310063 [Xanthomonas citri pv. citri]|nr:hypothetical protein XAC2852_310063 [Xanthomonas citri pv. citri]CEE84729.1 hypothetical protein XAC3218_440062 [Xanthomonas citri pv. citri]CEH60280.1 hypothetical protein XAC3610_4440012 [Xanthomonas citri pv. citri]CEH61698.1 hypothetical protein XAC3615_4820006 [Xanthomonas citri pv. citri]CEH70240.1 hypothetical protein XACS582_4790016 [Xanthomonas citri pv. citri]